MHEIVSVDQFAHVVDSWYENVLARLKHLMEIPTGTSMELEDNGITTAITLEYDALKGFIAALQLVHLELTCSPPFLQESDEE